jgi:hypothetical protein
LDEAIAHGRFFAAIDKLLFNSAQLWKLRENSSAAQSGDQIGGVSDGGIRGDTGESVGSSTLQPYTQIGKRGGSALSFVGFD